MHSKEYIYMPSNGLIIPESDILRQINNLLHDQINGRVPGVKVYSPAMGSPWYLENKGIVFKARWFVRPDINTGATII